MTTIPDKEEIRRMNRRAYVDNARGVTKVVLGDDEWQVEFKITNAIEAKKKIVAGEFEIKNVVPSVIDENVLNIRKELTRLSLEIVEIYEKAPKKPGFVRYDTSTVRQTNKIAYEIMNIKTYGLIHERKTSLF
ncbi:hypothetical protein HYI36_20130 [Bacillus sp. Gen3]|nr:hypothetical protein [Bacillus sp. Gen3]